MTKNGVFLLIFHYFLYFFPFLTIILLKKYFFTYYLCFTWNINIFIHKKCLEVEMLEKKYFPGNKISFGNNFFNMNSGELIILWFRFLLNKFKIHCLFNSVIVILFDSDLKIYLCTYFYLEFWIKLFLQFLWEII